MELHVFVFLVAVLGLLGGVGDVRSAGDTCLAGLTSSSDTCNCTSEPPPLPARPRFCYKCLLEFLPFPLESLCEENSTVRYGSTCNFSCPTGYKLIGNSSLTCTTTGFDLPLPVCENITCSIPAISSPLQVGQPCSSMSDVIFNTSCDFSCQLGFTLNGSSEMTCTETGEFDNEMPSCENITCSLPAITSPLQVGQPCSSMSDVIFNASCDFSCQLGFTLNGNSEMTCTETGEFDNEIPSCENITCSIPAITSPLQVGQPCSSMSYVIFDTSCDFSCQLGFTLNGNSKMTCTETGEFDNQVPTCDNITCSIPAISSPLQVGKPCSSMSDVIFNTSCVFSCQLGFTLNGNSEMTCTETGEFDNQVPTCDNITCAVPVISSPLQVDQPCSSMSDVIINTSCDFSCQVGYTLIGYQQMTCTETGEFDNQIPTCENITCSVPAISSPLQVGQPCSSMSYVIFNTSCDFSCQLGFTLNGNSKMTCTETGEFDNKVPTCDNITCPVPAITSPLQVGQPCSSMSDVIFNTSCDFSCDQNYTLIGYQQMTCTETGEFDNQIPTCENMTCPVPDISSPLQVGQPCSSMSDVIFNTSCDFSCDQGYTLNGSSEMTCTETGEFDNQVPTCQNITCTVPAISSPLQVGEPCSSMSDVIFNSSCEFSCHQGYTLIGYQQMTCTETGEFDNQVPTCEKMCSVPDGLDTNCTQEYVTIGTTCKFECNTIKPLIMTCTAAEDWKNLTCTNLVSTIESSGVTVSRKRRAVLELDSPTVILIENTLQTTIIGVQVVEQANVTIFTANNLTSGNIRTSQFINVMRESNLPVATLIEDIEGAVRNISAFTVLSFTIIDVESLQRECDDNPCRNDGTCSIDFDNLNYTCTCQPSYTGLQCEVPLNSGRDPNLLVAILVPIFVVIAFLLIVLACCAARYRYLYHQQNGHKQHHLAVRYQAERSTSTKPLVRGESGERQLYITEDVDHPPNSRNSDLSLKLSKQINAHMQAGYPPTSPINDNSPRGTFIAGSGVPADHIRGYNNPQYDHDEPDNGGSMSSVVRNPHPYHPPSPNGNGRYQRRQSGGGVTEAVFHNGARSNEVVRRGHRNGTQSTYDSGDSPSYIQNTRRSTNPSYSDRRKKSFDETRF